MNKNENILGTERIGKLLVKYSIPGIISMLVNSIYNLVDQIFISQGVGILGNGATTVSFPFVQLLLALALMTSAGTAANASLNLGRQDQEEADHYVGTGFAMAVFWGMLLLVLGQIFMVPMLQFFGAKGDILPLAVDYSRIILIGFPFVTTGICMNDLIRADGSPRYAMFSMLSGAVVNLIFDPVFIFVCHWGVVGGALATIMGQILTFFLSLYKFRKLKTLNFNVADLKPKMRRVRMVLTIGMSAFLTQMANMAASIIMNNQAVKYGALSIYGPDIPVGCFGIIMKINSIMMSIILGITSSTQPIFSYNFGAGKYSRVSELVKKACIATFIVGCTGWFCFQNFPQQIVSIFKPDSELYNEFAVMCMKNMTLTIFVMGIPMLAGVYFQAVGKPMKAIILSLSRQILFLIPLIIFLPMFIGIKGVMFSYPISDVFSITLSTILLTGELKMLKQMEAKKQATM